MAEREKKCKWYFSDQPQGGQEIGPNNAMEQSFKKHPYASLVRESIQNSLDAVLDKSRPVSMKYEFREIKSVDYPNLFEIGSHIQGCMDYYPKNKNAKDVYMPMLKLLDGCKNGDSLKYIRVSDYNTKGMKYTEETDSPFYAFVRSAGVSAKENTTAGGSFGFGKAAYFLMSPISTILVSTYTDNNETYFEGVSSLCTHLYNGVKKMSVGYYDDSEGKPVSSPDDIPSVFRRSEPGTDINILGYDFYFKDDIKKEMAEAVLRNFWMAIYSKHLEVEIGGDILINKDNLSDMMLQYFPEEEDKTRKSGYDNPRPYFDAVRLSGTSDRYVKYETDLSLIGHTTLYVNKSKGVSDKIAYIRDLQMLVFSKKNKTNYGFNAVFYCDDKKGNEMLRMLENPAHDEWSVANWPIKTQKGYANQVLKEIEDYKNECIADLFESKNKIAIDIIGLEQFLYIPTSLDEDEDKFGYSNDDRDNLFGEPSGDTMDDGTSPTTDIPQSEENPIVRKPANETPTGQVLINKVKKASASDCGSLRSGHGEASKKTRSKGIEKPGDIGDVRAENPEGKKGIFASPISISYRTFSQMEDGKTYHYVVLHSPEELASIRLHFFGVGEESNEELSPSSTNIGKIDGNVIRDIHLSKGTTRLKIRFEDNMMHTLKLSAEVIHEV